jgi:hypothetical protein
MVGAMRFHRAFGLLAVACTCLGVAQAVVISTRKVGNRTVMCMHSGLMSNLSDCGNRSDWYSFVFIGSISAIKPSMNDEMEIQIVPEEVFSGKPDKPLVVLTSQGLCLPNLVVGDRWLFYLRKENGKPIILDYYGNDSLPVAQAQYQISTLRRLQRIGEFGILRGSVVRGWSFDGKTLPDAHVTADRQSDHKRFVAVTNAEGRYEFQPLPPGQYKITVARIGAYRPGDSEIGLDPGGCWDLTLDKSH